MFNLYVNLSLIIQIAWMAISINILLFMRRFQNSESHMTDLFAQ